MKPIYTPIEPPPPGLWGFYALLFFVAVAVMIVVLMRAEKKERRLVLEHNRRLRQEGAGHTFCNGSAKSHRAQSRNWESEGAE